MASDLLSTEPSTPGPLNPGNVVSAAVRIYRDRFKTYFGLSLRACLWAFVPVYGWAKYAMHTGLMSRLAFQELMNQPETPRDAYRQLNPKMWFFLGLGLLLALIFFGAYIAVSLIALIAGGVVGGLAGFLFSNIWGEAGAVIGGILFALIFILGLLFGLLWVLSRFIIAEVPLAIEPTTDASTSIGRSWTLTKSAIIRIQFVVMAAYLVTIPVILAFNLIPQIAVIGAEFGSPLYWTLYSIGIAFSFAANIMTLPFWQVVKGVLYYDLRSRREGLDLTIQDTLPNLLDPSDEML